MKRLIARIRAFFSPIKRSHPNYTVINQYVAQYPTPRFTPQFPSKLPDKPHVFIYNINEESFTASNPFIRHLDIPGKGKEERWRLITSLPKFMYSPKFGLDDGEISFVAESGVRIAVDLINPDNLGTDLDREMHRDWMLAEGKDLSRKGVFYSLSFPPNENDLIAAERRLSSHR